MRKVLFGVAILGAAITTSSAANASYYRCGTSPTNRYQMVCGKPASYSIQNRASGRCAWTYRNYRAEWVCR